MARYKLGIFKIIALISLFVIDVVMWVLFGAVLKDTAKTVVLIIAIILLVAFIVWGIYELWILTQSLGLPDEVKAWGTEDCKLWSESYVYMEYGEQVDFWIGTNMESHGRDRTPVFTSTLVLKSSPVVYGMVIRADKIENSDPVHFSFSDLETKDKWGYRNSLKDMIEAIVPDKIPVSRNVSRKRDPVTGKVTEELLREDKGYDEENEITFNDEEQQR